ncbi:RING finger protein 10 [Amphibalanus amphitrite]|uniref:E3 ubiquitin-protein ligase RNF10 n=1 Tax=Amphibalanus amphitrite TaxID=1232801 RepID=A0A6A4VKP1_AMPAM|nr:RING finger protein 10-like isoform X2 [Amphibalanus amphitrite]KAF0293599.1 RING finger protein 10 [Amphibalanus amphitrite]
MPIEDSNMEKKNVSKASVLTKCNPDPKSKQSLEYNGNGRGGGCRGGRRPAGFGGGAAGGAAVGRRPQPQRSRQVADKRPRERAQPAAGAEYGHREQVADARESNSAINRGSKKGFQDVSYLVNFRCESARDAHAERYSGSQWHQQRYGGYQHHEPRPQWAASRVFRPKHVKEQYLQARCQLVVRDDGDYAACLGDADRLVDWTIVEQVWLQEDEPTTCPICLYPPVAARVTRCGHTYCCACLLHYLALSDQAARKCPICEETVHPDQVRRCRLVPRPPARLGDTVAFRLMRRQPGSLLGQPVQDGEPWEELVTLGDDEERQRLARIILATPKQVASEILAPERAALELQLAELADEPEACFVQQALTQLEEQEAAVAERALAALAKPQRPDPATAAEQATPLPTAAADSAIVYRSAFDEQTVEQAAEEAAAELATGARQRSLSETSCTEITAADLEVPAAAPGPAAAPRRDDHEQPLYYYQAEGGEHVYLHALNCRMLLQEHGAWERCPRRLAAQLIDVDAVTMTAPLRQRLRSLRHLPLATPLQVVEVRLRPPDVSTETVALFKDQIKKREQRRKDKQRRERQHERRLRQQGSRRAPPIEAVYDAAFPSTAAELPPRPPTPPLLQSAVTPLQSPTEAAQLGSSPSFAQLLRAAGAGGGPAVAWPSAVRPPPAPAPAPAAAREDEPNAVPSYSDSWSADLAAALERATQDRAAANAGSDAAGAEGRSTKGKKGKKGRGTVLLSGGLTF